MNKKLITLAVTSALAASSAVNADSKNVDIYGKLYPQFEISKSSGASPAVTPVSTMVDDTGALTTGGSVFPQTNRVQSTNSYLGFKGQEDLGGGMKAWFQIENKLNLDTQDGAWSSRNSAAGLTTAFGTVLLGNWDTVFKQLSSPVSFLGVSSGNFVSTSKVMTELPFSRSGGTPDAASFWLRQTNYVQYESPTVGGVNVMLGYSPDESESVGNNKRLLSAGVKFEQGPIYVALMQEVHKDFFGLSNNVDSTIANVTSGNVSSKDTATRASFMISFGGTSIGVDVANLDYDETQGNTTAGNIATYEKKNIEVTALQKLGKLSIAATVAQGDEGDCTRVGAACTTTGLGAKQISLGAKYDFSKRTSVFLIGARAENDEAAAFRLTRGVSPGADSTAVAIGISHNI